MIVIVGLGNPGREYEKTHHNMGFMALDAFANKNGFVFSKKKYNALISEGIYEGKKVILIKPQTYMNLSGTSVNEVIRLLKLPIDKLCVVYDDIDLDCGAIRFRTNGSAGTHNGMRDIISRLGTDKFSRIRIGIGRPQANIPLADYVLSRIPRDKEALYIESFDKVSGLIAEFIIKEGKVESKSI